MGDMGKWIDHASGKLCTRVFSVTDLTVAGFCDLNALVGSNRAANTNGLRILSPLPAERADEIHLSYASLEFENAHQAGQGYQIARDVAWTTADFAVAVAAQTLDYHR